MSLMNAPKDNLNGCEIIVISLVMYCMTSSAPD